MLLEDEGRLVKYAPARNCHLKAMLVPSTAICKRVIEGESICCWVRWLRLSGDVFLSLA